jgi:hypothetical protein
MTFPGLILGTLVGALIGGALHLITGGHIGRLLLYILFGIAGFWAGDILAEFTGLNFLSYGPVHYGMAVLGSLLVTGIGYWLSLVQTTTVKK